MMKVIGIDPGLSGAIALVSGNGYASEVEWSEVCPIIPGSGKNKNQYDISRMVDLLVREERIDSVCLEKVGAMPKQGSVSMFRFGMGFGIWQGILAACRIPYELVIPQRWKRALVANTPGNDPKQKALLVSKQLYPDHCSKFLKKNAGQAEAILIATYGLRKIGEDFDGKSKIIAGKNPKIKVQE